ncbi:MAG: leukotoxin LktA family filamentous adhesin [Beijerinckiaceae bacterium]|nr:leukotoxin LktA family filamentous adhesin [Beijerinckiaceae bacterium]
MPSARRQQARPTTGVARAKRALPTLALLRHRPEAPARAPGATVWALRNRCLVGQAMALALWNAPAFAQNVITTDGRTQTAIAVEGATTTITTRTIAGGAGYNSFNRFEQGAGSTVNMHLPQNTGALVNIVRNGPVVVNGILNSYKNGSIGGHVYFSDSSGFTVGPSGVINTGRLTVNTPTREFLEGVISPGGVVNETLAARLRANDVPISPDGHISIEGRVNAKRGVTLHGHSVSVSGQITANAAPVDVGERRRRHQTAFAASVNTSGVRHGGAMVARKGGGIEIVAAGTARISGTLSANASGRRSAGTITVRSGKGTTIAATARLSATGAAPSARTGAASAGSAPAVNTGDGGKISITSDAAISIARGARFDASAARGVAGKGGEIIVFAGTNLDAAGGSVYQAKGGLSGDGGFIELSAKDTVRLGAVEIDLSARAGKAGTFLIDPADIVITGSSDLSVGSAGTANIFSQGANVRLEATSSITIAADGTVDSRQFNRNANNGELSAANPSTGDSGSITLKAPRITVYGTVLADVSAGSSFTAGNVTLDATTSDIRIAGMATATSTIDIHGTVTGHNVEFKADATAVASYADVSAGSLGALAAQSVGGILFGLNGGYVGSRVLSRINVVDGARVEASGDLTISAKARQEATMPAVTLSGANPFAAAVSIGEIFGTVTADVASGATITVGRDLAVVAENDVRLAVSAISLSVGTGLVSATMAYGFVDVTTAAKVHSGATVTAGSAAGTGSVSVTAKNTNSFSTSSTAVAASGGVASISVAYSDYKAEADALLGVSLGTSANKVQHVGVQALSDTVKNATSSSSTTGDNVLFNAGPSGTTVSTLLSQLLGSLSNASSGVPIKVGSAVTIANSNLSASAAIAADAGDTAPTIHASGNVVVASRQRDFGVRLLADSSTNSNSKDPTGSNPEAQVSLSFGIAVGNYSHKSTASIGSGVIIHANRIGVAGLSENPISNTWTNWSGLGEVFSHLNGNLGIVNNILTSYANASSSSTDLGLAGAVGYFRVSNDTSAYVASGATLNQTSGIGAWSTTLAANYLQNWSQGVSIVADTDQHSIDVGGNFGFTGGVNGGTGSAAGGSLLDIGRSSRTVAAVAAGAIITATDLSVTADTSDKMFVIATTSGRSAGTVALNGMVSLSSIQNQTLASISNRATVTANTVKVKADQFVSVFALSGALVLGGGNGIGISLAVMDAGSLTRAYVGDNSDDLSDGRLAGVAPQGLITTGAITVEASTTGRVTAASVAAAAADGAVAITLPPGTSKVVRDMAAAFAKTSSSGPSLSAAGTAAVALTTMGTSAWIENARLQEKAGAGLTTSVRALNSTIIEVGSGAAAANLAGTSGASGAIAGAVAIGVLDNSTDSRISGATLTGAYDTSVQAIAGGRATIVGVGLAVSAGGNGAAAISAAVGLVTNRVNASIANSAITASTATSVSKIASVNAYQTTDIGIGGGAAYGGAQSGVGLSLTYASILDPSGEDAVSATIRNSSLVNLNGLNVVASNRSRIVSGAVSAGLGGNGLSGAFVFNRVKPTTRAEIAGTAGAAPTITVGGDVVVAADGSRETAFDAIIAGRQTFSQADTTQVDFSGSVANGGDANPTGAAIVAITGAVQVGRNNVGISFLSNEVAQGHIATIDNVILTATGDLSVRAQDGASITGVAVGLGGATGQFAGVASVALQSIDNVVRAGITGTSTIVTARDILLNGSATSNVRGSAGSLGLGFGQAAVGLSVVENNIANTVTSTVEDARLRSSRDVVVQSRSAGTISTLSIGIAISRNVGLAGSVANSSVATEVAATVKRADIIADNNLGVIATNKDGIAVSAGALGAAGGSPSIAGGLSIVSNSIGGSTIASIGENSAIDARVNGTGSLSISSGALVSPPSLTTPTGPSTTLPDLAMAQRNVRGLVVVATSQQSVMANAVTAGVAVYPISGAVGYVTIRNDLGGTTSASVDQSLVDTRLAGGQNPSAIVIDAASHSYAGSYIVVGAIGGVAGAGADANTTMKRRTSAALTNSTTGTIATSQGGLGGVGAVQVAASSSQLSTGQSIGFTFGLNGAAATGLVNNFEAVTTASLDQGLLNAASLTVKAESSNGFHGTAGVGSGAAGAALGSAFVVGRSKTTTLATIGGGANVTTLNIFGTLNVLATSTNRFSALAAGGTAGGAAAIAGMVNLIDIANTTRAGLYGVASTQTTPPFMQQVGQSIDGSFNIIARETTTIAAETGSAAYSGGGYGAGAAVNVASIDGSVLADLTNSTVSTPGAVVVQATSDRNVDSEAFTVGAGSTAGLAAAVTVISVGTSAPSGADLNVGGDGTLSRVNQLTAVDAGFTLSTSGLATYRTLRGALASGQTDEQLRTAANAEYLALLQNGTVVAGVLTLTDSGVQALRANSATGLQSTATDQQVRDYAASRYTALKAANLQYVIGDAGLNAYRDIVQAATPNATDTQVKIAADDAYARLLANGVPASGLYSLRQSGIAVYQAAADAELGRTATATEVRDYAASQYAWFTTNRARTATPTAISATALLDSNGAQTGATALGGSITAASVSVTSTSRTATDNTALGIGIGGVGVGAALGYTTVADAVSARLDQMSVTTGSITVNASAVDGAGGIASRIAVEAGAGSGTAAAGAAVAQGSVSNTLTARLGGTLTVTGATSVNASTTQGSRADALGAAAAGGGALGVSLASSSLNGVATADLAANATVSGGTSLGVTASSNGISYASARAGAGGLLVAGVGADARATDTSRVEAHLGDNASVNVGTGAITVSATATPDAKAAAYGVSVTGGLAVGVAISRATVNQTVIAAMDGGAAAQRALTAGTLSILATGTIAGTPVTSIGGSPGQTHQFVRGGTGAAAWSFAGSGSYYASAVGSDAGASTSSTVTASAGANVRLPNAVVRIAADNTTRQIASSTGFSIAGKYSVGAVLADARSTSTTSATLGDDASLLGGAGSSFSLTAAGQDTQIAKAVSGSGGLVAGAGAQADTANTATATARIGARVQIGANTILVNAKHTDEYANLVDAVQAAALGASASLASHNARSDVLVDIGASVLFSAIGNGTKGCFVTSCVQGIELESRNIFRQLALGDTISAGAGGGINGVGAKSTTGIDGTSKVVVGNDANFASGGNALSSPGPIAIQAITELAADDTVTLTTGGLLQGSGVTSQYRADADNEVTLGTSNVLNSAGAINIGTYTTAFVKTNALVTTYGLAAVGVAEADTNIRTDQTITIGANSALTGLDNVNVTAGRDASGITTTGIYGDATAVGYVRGLIAVPDADAATDLQNHARLNVATGAALLSAQNVTLGAYNGTVTPNTRGAGHGYQLYFIPVTQRDESPNSAATSTVVMNGRAVGGVFREQQIVIGCGPNGGSICGTTEQPTVYIKAGGAPVTVTHDPAFNAVDYVRANYTTFTGTVAETAVADTLVGGISPGLVRAYRISQLYAAGGNVFVNGDTIQGNGTLTANGGPTITVVNNSAAYLILDGGAYIPDLSTGQILFTGAAQGQNGLTRNTVNANGTASVIINNAYTRADIGDWGPALLIGGDITNLGGLVSINNTQGSFGFSGQRIDALQFNVTVPNGAVAVASNGPNGMYNAGASPMAEWGHAITYPGATPGQPSQNYVINNTINAIANTLYFGSGSSLNYNLYHNINDGSNAGLRYSTIFYGNCIGYGATGMNCVGGYHFGNGINFALIPIVPKYYESNTVQAQGGGTQIYGAQVAIKASVININASIEAGRITERQGNIGSNVGSILASIREDYLSAGYTTASFAEIFGGGWAATNAAPVVWDIVNNRLILNDVNASSGGGSVLLDGQIISTNSLGRIKVNGGFGNVTLNNQSGLELVTNRINTGTAAGANASVSKITIVDRLKAASENTTVFVYTPGSGIAKYITSNGAQPILSGANASTPAQFIAGATTSYDVKDGMRYEWTQQLFVTKDGLVVNNPNAQGVWRYNSGSANNPWVYVPAPASGLWGDNNSSGPDYWNQSTTPQGRVTYNQFHAVSNPVFYQTLQGGVTEVINAMQTYGRCNGGNPSFCDFDFRGDTGSTANSYWNYNYVKDAWLQVTSSVRADYDFGISFAGNAAGSVNITSNSAIRLQGNVINPSGTATFNATAGSITQAPNVSILTRNLTLAATGSVGAAGAPIAASITDNGVLTIDSGEGGIHLAMEGAARVARLNAGAVGDVNVSVAGGLTVAPGFENATHVTGNNITLRSAEGGIGGIANPLRIQANAATAANGSQIGGVVNIAAQGDIGIRQLSGNLRVGQIASTGGNVRVDVVSGTLKAANAQTAAQSLSTEQLSVISSKLKLTQADGADAAAQASVAAFERSVNETYTLYSSLVRNGSVTNGVFRLSDTAIPLYQALANLALGRTASADEVRAYAAERYAGYATVFDKAYGAGWSSTSRFQTASLENGYSFSVTAQNATPGLANSATIRQLGVATFERDVTAAYGLYTGLIVNGAVTNGVFTLNQNAVAAYQSAANAALGRSATEGEVRTYAAGLYAGYAATFTSAYGDNWSSQARFQPATLESNYSFSVAATDARPGLATSATVSQLGVSVFERNVNETYGLYNALIGSGTVANGAFTLNQAAIGGYQAAANASLGRTATSAEVSAYAANRYTSYAATFSSAYGADWTSQVSQNFNASVADARPGLAASITANSTWQTGQLIAAIDQAALQPASGVVGNGTPIIIGRDVSLNIGGSIGSLAPDVAVSLDAIRNGTLSNTELQALAVATTPGSVKLIGTNGSGQRVAVASLETVPLGVTLTSVDIAQTAPLFVSATGTFSGSAQGDIYVQGTTAGQSGSGSLKLGRVTATGAINLQAPQAITVATAPSSTTPLHAVQIEAGTDLTLAAAGGSIGSAATPLTYQIGGRLVSASAGAGDAYLVKPTGNAEIGRIFAQGTASVTASAGSITSYLPGVAISAQTVLLNASGNVGSQATPFAVQSADDGEISGQIGGSGWISTPTLASQTAVAQRIGALTANGSLTLTADAELRVLRSLTAATGALSATAGAIVMETGATATAAGRVTLASATNVTLGRVASALAAPQGTASIAVTAAGAIVGNAGVVNLGAAQTGGVIALNAGTGIGTTLDAVSFAAPSLSARSLQGDVNLRTASTTRVTALTADLGAAAIAADSTLTIDALTSGGAASATSTASTLTVTTLNAGGSTTLSAAGLVAIDSATTTAGDLVIASTNGDITATTLNSAGALSLTAQGAIAATTATSGTTTQATSSGDTLSITTLSSGATATLAARNGVTLGSATTTLGDLTVSSSHAGITATTLNAGSAASLTAQGAISVTTSMASDSGATATSNGSTLNIVALTAGGTTTLSGSGAVTIGSARTTGGDLSIVSLTAGIGATTLDAPGALSVNAPGAIAVTTATSGSTTQATSSADTLAITTLSLGGAATMAGRNGVTIGSAMTMTGDLSVTSSHAGIVAATLSAAGAATLTAQGAISVTTSLISTGGGATITSFGGTLDLVALTAGGASILSGSGAVTLGTARTTSGDLSIASLTAGITATTLDAAGALTLTAPGAITVTTTASGTTTQATSSAGTLAITTLTSGGTATLAGRDGVTLGNATTTLGDLTIGSSQAGITAATLRAAGAAGLSAAQAITIASLASGGTSLVQTSAGPIDITTLNAGGTAQVIGATTVSLGTATTTAGDLRAISAGGPITATRLTSAGGVEATGPGAVTIGELTSGGAVDATSSGGALRIDTLSSGQIATLVGAAGVTLDSARTLTGSLVATASAGGIQARSLNAADRLTLSARDLIALTEAASANETAIVSTSGIVRATTLRAGAALTVDGAGGVDLQSALTTLGDVVLRSSNAGLALGAVTAARDIALLAQGTIAANSLVAGRDLSASSLGSTLAIQAFSAGRDISLVANGAIGLDAAEAGRNLSVTSSAAGVTLRSARAGAAIGLDAAGLLTVTSLRSGGATTLSGGAMSIGALVAGDTATLRGVGTVSLGSVSTLIGDIAVASTAGLVDATSLDAAGALALQAAATVQVGTARSGGAAEFVSTGGDVTVARLSAGRDGRVLANGAVRLENGGSGGSLTLASANSLVSIGAASAGSDISVTAQRIVFGALDAGRDAGLASAGAINGDSIVATQTLTALAGASGGGSIRIAVGAARNSAFTAPDDVRLGRYGAGDSIVILGNTIVSNIVQLAGASGGPLDLTIAGSRGRTAEQVTLSVDAASFRTTRFETVDGALATTSRRFDLLQAFVPGALRLDAPGLRVFANNRSPAPLTGFDVQLYQRDRPFFVSLNGGSLSTNAMIIRFDSDQISIPGGNGGEPEVSMARDMPRLGASMLTGPSFGETARSFVLDETGRWRSNDPETTASIGGGVATRVNLAGGGEQP